MNFQVEDFYVACVRCKPPALAQIAQQSSHNLARVNCEDFRGVAGSFFHRR
jgi:hypothetical protein